MHLHLIVAGDFTNPSSHLSLKAVVVQPYANRNMQEFAFSSMSASVHVVTIPSILATDIDFLNHVVMNVCVVPASAGRCLARSRQRQKRSVQNVSIRLVLRSGVRSREVEPISGRQSLQIASTTDWLRDGWIVGVLRLIRVNVHIGVFSLLCIK